ncbi:MAG: SH3 domain-containing protein [Campylobacterota bacterium]|nr:SH3 domain-containing protein [Campylobacterota bacterium]
MGRLIIALVTVLIIVGFSGCGKTISQLNKTNKFQEWFDTNGIEEQLQNAWNIKNVSYGKSDIRFHNTYKLMKIDKKVFNADSSFGKTFDYNNNDNKSFLNSGVIHEDDNYRLHCEATGQNELHIEKKKKAKKKVIYTRFLEYNSKFYNCKNEMTLLPNSHIVAYMHHEYLGGSRPNMRFAYYINFYNLENDRLIKKLKLPTSIKSSGLYYLEVSPDSSFVVLALSGANTYKINISPLSKNFDTYFNKMIKKAQTQNDLNQRIKTLDDLYPFLSLTSHYEDYYRVKFKTLIEKNSIKDFEKFVLNKKTNSAIGVKKANIRKKATTKSKIIATLKKGNKIEILNSSGKWYRIKFNNSQLGWIYSSLVDSGSDPVFARYKPKALNSIKKLKYQQALSSNNIKLIKSYFKKYGKEKSLVSKLISLYRKKQNINDYIKAFKLSKDLSDLKQASEYAITNREKLLVEHLLIKYMGESKVVSLKNIDNNFKVKSSKSNISMLAFDASQSIAKLKPKYKIAFNTLPFKLLANSYKITIDFQIAAKYKYKPMSTIMWRGKDIVNNTTNYTKTIILKRKDGFELTKNIEVGDLIVNKGSSILGMGESYKLLEMKMEAKVVSVQAN